MDINYRLKQNIKDLLANHNLSQAEFGKVLGITQKIVSNWVNGVSSVPLEKLILIKERYGYSIDQMVFSELGRQHPAYDDFVRNNHPGLLNEEKGAYQLKDGDVVLNDQVFDDGDKMGALVRWLTRNHEKLSNDSLYELYTGRIILEHEKKELRNKVRNELLGGKKTNNP